MNMPGVVDAGQSDGGTTTMTMTAMAPDETRATADLTAQLQEVLGMTTGELVARYREVFGEPTRSRNKAYLRKKVGWRIQELAEGGLSQRALDRIQELAPSAPARWRTPRPDFPLVAESPAEPEAPKERDPRLPPVGTVLVRAHQGAQHAVTVLDDGFEYAGEQYRSLSGIARAITGTPWNGFLFFKKALRQAVEAAS